MLQNITAWLMILLMVLGATVVLCAMTALVVGVFAFGQTIGTAAATTILVGLVSLGHRMR
jgi:hypothetical protein